MSRHRRVVVGVGVFVVAPIITVTAVPAAAAPMPAAAESEAESESESEAESEAESPPEAEAGAETDLLPAPLRGASATPVSGWAFDLCAAPSLSDLEAWRGTSPYTTVNIYFGGTNRACAQPNLTAEWVHDVTARGWGLLPTYVGHQPSCVYGNPSDLFTEADATEVGTADAADAVELARLLGLLPGSALYADIEHYDRSDMSCRRAVLRYMTAWTTYLHDAGYLSGYYAHQASGIRELADAYESPSVRRPDAIWSAQWDERPALTGFRNVSETQWANWQRIKQYLGDHDETWGGVTLNIDSNVMRAPMATVARSFMVPLASPFDARSGPSTSYEVVRSYSPGEELPVVCQSLGEQIVTTRVWNRLATGAWISDFFTSTPSMTTFSGDVPVCTYPGQVTRTTLDAHTGPGADYPVAGAPLPLGALAYVTCQRSGSEVGSTRVWNQLSDGRWVTDAYVSNASDTTFDPLIPRCA